MTIVTQYWYELLIAMSPIKIDIFIPEILSLLCGKIIHFQVLNLNAHTKSICHSRDFHNLYNRNKKL